MPSKYQKVFFDTALSETQEKIFKEFENKKPELYELINTLSDDPKGQEQFKNALDEFYAKDLKTRQKLHLTSP